MASRTYERLPIEDFGRRLITSGDLDPVYIALNKMEMDHIQLSKWLVAYWCMYHCGSACWLSEQKDFWGSLMKAAVNVEETPIGGRWPRGHERRHFRGTQATDAVASLHARHPSAGDMVAGFNALSYNGGIVPFRAVSDLAQEERGFGPWIAFKIADMIDRLGIAPVSFDQAEVFMFKDPREAALRLWREKARLDQAAMPKDPVGAITQVVDYLRGEFKDLTAPPGHERPIGLQEIETVLCKWKSHVNGHYPLMNDTDEINTGLDAWSLGSPTARLMRQCMPRGTAG